MICNEKFNTIYTSHFHGTRHHSLPPHLYMYKKNKTSHVEMNIHTIHNNFNNESDFVSMLEKNKPVNLNDASNIVGYIIASDKADKTHYYHILFSYIGNDDDKELLLHAVGGLKKETKLQNNNTVKVITTAAAIDNATDTDTDDDMSEKSDVSCVDDDDEYDFDDSDDEFNYK